MHGMMQGEAGKLLTLLNEHEGDIDAAAAALKQRWADGVNGALHANYAQILPTIGLREVTLI